MVVTLLFCVLKALPFIKLATMKKYMRLVGIGLLALAGLSLTNNEVLRIISQNATTQKQLNTQLLLSKADFTLVGQSPWALPVQINGNGKLTVEVDVIPESNFLSVMLYSPGALGYCERSTGAGKVFLNYTILSGEGSIAGEFWRIEILQAPL